METVTDTVSETVTETMTETLKHEGEELLRFLSENAEKIIKGGLGLAATYYLAKYVCQTEEFQDILSLVRKWGGKRRWFKYWFEVPNPTPTHPDYCPLFTLPDSGRRFIWSYVSPADLKALRLVCKKIQRDIDYEVGLNLMVDCKHPESFNWVQTVAAQGLHVYNIGNIQTSQFIYHPDLLKKLEMEDRCAISPADFGFLFGLCPNLENLSVHVLDDQFVTIGRNREIFQFLSEKQQQLDFLRVQYQRDTALCKWEMRFENVPASKMKPNGDGFVYDYLPSRLRTIVLNFERFEGINGVNFARTRLFWKAFLECQTQMQTMCCNYGSVCWDVLAEVIEVNAATIRRIELHNVNSWDYWSVAEDREIMFDWNFFHKTKKLERLVLVADDNPRQGPTQCIPLLPGDMHLKVLFLNMGVTYWKVFEGLIMTCCPTLERVTLLRLTIVDQLSGEISLFDWSMFKDCKNLTQVVIGGTHDKHLSHVNLDVLPTRGLLDFKMCWSILSCDDLWLIGVTMLDMNQGYDFLDDCTVLGLEGGETPMDFIWRTQGEEQGSRFQKALWTALHLLYEYSVVVVGLIGTGYIFIM